MASKDLLGKVTHYYDRLGVAVIKLDKPLKTGNKLKFVHGQDEFYQSVESMQLEHEQIESGKKGQEVAVKVDKNVKSGTLVYLE